MKKNIKSFCYDPVFTKYIQSIKPDWFNKKNIKSFCYDPVFTKYIQSIKPDWFNK